jgi:ribose transport system ATP-binding protein
VTTPLLAVEDLGKVYGRHQVLSDVDFRLAAGEATAVLGENGAGKSTLVKILAGAVRPDSGRVLVDGHQVHLTSPRKALEHGIAFIPQELVYVPKLTVAENICLGRWPRRAGFTSARALRRQAAEEAGRFGFDLPLDRDMDTLTLAQQQMVEILKALARRSRVILLDEPTAALSSHDSERLLRLMTELAADGVGVLYVTHRLDEVFRACRTAHVLRNGRLVRSGPVAQTTPRRVIEDMLGRSAEEAEVPRREPSRVDTEPVLEVRGWSRGGLPPLRDVTFGVGRGEIVGLYGVRGAGAEVVAETLGGLHPEVTGETVLGGRVVPAPRSPLAARRAGIAYVPADRKSDGLVLTLTVQQSLSMLVLAALSRLGIIARGRERATARGLAEAVHLRARGLGQTVGELSGGNQQKVLVGSRLALRPAVLVLQEPTRGVDVGARLELHRLLRGLADEGTATVLVTSDIEEAVNLSDRLLVVRDGAVVAEFHRPDPGSQPDVLHAAGGLD